MHPWANDVQCYQIYPLGLCGAPIRNDQTSEPIARLKQLHTWIEHLQHLGSNLLYLGPVFESTAHGYDTIDYFTVDRRLGSNNDLQQLIAAFHAAGIRVLLDGVFNHVGRDFWAFRDVQSHGQASSYSDWFAGLDFNQHSPYGDQFSYQGWHGHYDLVKLNLHNPAVREHLFQAVSQWIAQFGIDGLRLDAADQIDHDFLAALAAHCKSLRSDFLLIGEVVHGDYRQWANPTMLDSVTNYEAYKGLYSSLNDRNYFEIAYSLNRQFGAGGIYRAMPLYNFVDNHDVDRIASTLHNPAHLYPLHLLLYTMPGMPALYYGSEWGLLGQKTATSDQALRPALPQPDQIQAQQPDLLAAIRQLSQLRHEYAALRYGEYAQIYVQAEQLVFVRWTKQQTIVVALNAAPTAQTIRFVVPFGEGSLLEDRLNGGEIKVQHGQLQLTIPATWGQIWQLID
ncbi:MAG TPA: alpha-amylase [Herpetosiphon sp.]|uniref:Alpha amylase catalytic region n=1 Tax=Herpetosiphon aurantiacus (strain ATCC 23779 / DSM 785 / 114-95) TaxID=316274 RepID=A9AZD1_HERA2|nr:alpha-amylase family glycosyl hydrolase [Herpetosiphon sp.]ABX05075.1 alpha amylase catalytic region [Herpetosiphon aurantiacus DSM 785]HBW52058.1 alpha-amylase [Herpetosiphon sp.]